VLAVLAAFVLKVWGMVAIFGALGELLMERVAHRHALPLYTLLLGLVVLGAFKLVPWLGTWVWTVATLIGVGAALSTKFGRYEPWFEGALTVP